MRRRFFKVAFFSLMSLLAVVIAVGALIFWRVQQGPVSLTFMKPRIEAEMNKKLGGMSVKLSDVILERDKKSGVPSLRLRNIELRDPAGDLIARAPRAAITIDEHELLAGNVIPRSLELIGPRVLVKRNIEGGLELGFGEASPDDNSPIIIDDAAPESGKSGKSDQMGGAPPPIQPATSGAALLDILAGDTEGLLGGIQSIRVSGADISLFDESNDALWNAPGAELAFKKMPYGFAIVANAAIASGGEPWRTEIAANYRRETRTFQVNARISDLVPANVSDEIFALAQLAQFRCRCRAKRSSCSPTRASSPRPQPNSPLLLAASAFLISSPIRS